MKRVRASLFSSYGLFSLSKSVLLLAAVNALACPIVAWGSRSPVFQDAMAAASYAALVCWFAASLGLVCSIWISKTYSPVPGVLAGMLCRMTLPLLAGVIVSQRGGPVADAGFFGMLVVFYLISLVVETPLLLRQIRVPAETQETA